jgi:hypothetical protein
MELEANRPEVFGRKLYIRKIPRQPCDTKPQELRLEMAAPWLTSVERAVPIVASIASASPLEEQ